MFSTKEKMEILEKIGYEIIEDNQVVTRKARFIKSAHIYYVRKEGDQMKLEEAFKKELLKRIFEI